MLRSMWDETAPTEIRTLALPFFGPHLGRLVLSRLGREVRDHGHYWKFGVFFFEARTQSKALVRCGPRSEDLEDYRGRIDIQTQLGRATELADQICSLLEGALKQTGELGWQREGEAGPVPPRRSGTSDDEEPDAPPAIEPDRAPDDPTRVFISYRHTPRSKAVAESVEAALQQEPGVEVHRDVRDLVPGDDLRQYAVAIGRADVVVAVVSRPYFDSEHCMRELLFFERDGCADDPGAFRRKLIPIVLGLRLGSGHDEGIDLADGRMVSAIRQMWAVRAEDQGPDSLPHEEFGAIRRRVGSWLDRLARVFGVRDTPEEEAAGWPSVRDWIARATRFRSALHTR